MALKSFEKACLPPDAEEVAANETIAGLGSSLEKNTIENLEKGSRLINYARTFIKKAENLEKQDTKDKEVKAKINKNIEGLYQSAIQKLKNASNHFVQNESGKQIEMFAAMLFFKIHVHISAIEDNEESLQHFEGLK